MKKRILIVDDDKLVADTLSLVFQANGFDAKARYSAADGLTCALQFDPELMVLDVTMPERTGLQLAEDLEQQFPSTPILMLTAYTSNVSKAYEHASLRKKPVSVLSKPCRPEDLLREASFLMRTAAA